MHIAAMILGILGGLSLLTVSFLGYSLGAVGQSTALQVFSLAIPIIAFVGAGVVMKNGILGGALMLISAAGVLLAIGMNIFGIFLSLLLIIGGVLGIISGQGKPSESPAPILTRAPTLEEDEIPQRQTTEDTSARTDTESTNQLTQAVQLAPSKTLSDVSSEALTERESIDTPRKPVFTPKTGDVGTRNWALPLGGIIAVSLLGYFGLTFYENKQELDRVRIEKGAQERTAQQEAEARRLAEQQAEYERRARQEAAAREADAQRKAQGEADARKRAQEQAAAEKRARQEASAREAEALRRAQQEADARRKAQAIEARQIAREQAAAERKASLEVAAQRKRQDSLARLEKRYFAAQERAKKQYSSALARANGRADRVARAEDYYQRALAKAQKYYEENRSEMEGRYQDALTKAQKAHE